MVFDLTGSRALITGAGSANGIGFATAKILCEMGAAVFLVGLSPRVDARASELRNLGYNAGSAAADLTLEPSVQNVVTTAAEFLGGIDIVINNAGMTAITAPAGDTGETGGITDVTFAGWNASIARNLNSAFLVTKYAMPFVRKSAAGRIVMIASATGAVMAMRNEVAYAAAKAGMLGLVRGLAVDEAHYGVTANCVSAGWIATDSQSELEFKQGQATPLSRSAVAAEVAAGVAWIASREASYMTGQNLVIDGGNSIAEERG